MANLFFVFCFSGNLLKGRENDFLLTLHQLQEKRDFSIHALEVEVDKIKACVAEVKK